VEEECQQCRDGVEHEAVIHPYYEQDGITMYHGDCADVMASLRSEAIDLVLTDPPYPDYHQTTYTQTSIEALRELNCRQMVFWSAKAEFPLTYSAIHIWDKTIGSGSEYERIFERNGSRNFHVYRDHVINSSLAARFMSDVFTEHPSQKPIRLMRRLVKLCPEQGLILDPFMGSGTTLRAAKDLGRRAIGIEIVERYCEIAAKRLAQGVLFGAEVAQ
jgi:DNA modification methylase